MPNIDTSTIEGFDSMTADQKVEALLKVDIPEAFDASRYVAKDVFDKKAHEAAELSKQLKAKSTDEENAKAEQDKLFNEMKARVDQLEKEKQLTDLTNSYLAMGYDKDLAADTAKARMEGDTKKEFENGEKHRQALEKKIKEELMKDTPRPGGSGGGNPEDDPAVAKAKELAKKRLGSNQSYEDIMSKYK